MAAPRHLLEQLAERHHPLQLALEDFAEHLGAVGQLGHARFDGPVYQVALEIPLVLDEGLGTPALGAEERRLRNVDVPAIDQRKHLTIEERQQESADVRPIDVGVGHDDDAVVAHLVGVEVLAADTGSERRDHGFDLVAAEHLVEARFLDIQDLALDRQDGLEPAIASLLG